VSTFEGATNGRGRRVAIVAARFNGQVTDTLVAGAVDALTRHGVDADDVDVVWVPGAFEIPLIARRLADTGTNDAIICLGAVIKGDTYHFELVANETARAIMDISAETGVPVIFEVLATQDLAQAEARAGGSHGNKGWEAAEAALRMADLLAQLPKGDAR
jgi:6,7-dimethyl-8-ribityllumazine synthase